MSLDQAPGVDKRYLLLELPAVTVHGQVLETADVEALTLAAMAAGQVRWASADALRLAIESWEKQRTTGDDVAVVAWHLWGTLGAMTD